MPSLLRRDAIRLLEAGVEALNLAVTGLGSTKRSTYRNREVAWTLEIGLLGCAVELTMAACLIQAGGPSSIIFPSGSYKTFGTIRLDFIRLLKESPAGADFISAGVDHSSLHREALIEAARSLATLVPVRAAALHAARGLVHEVAVFKANEVADFLTLLSRSTRLRPYLEPVPRCELYCRDRLLLVEDLARRLLEGKTDMGALASIFLVLPDVPEDEPEWLGAFDRVTVAPKEGDVEYLMRVLREALPATLRRAHGGTGVLSAVVRPGDPGAIPISPHYLRASFTTVKDRWHADRATANGRLSEGFLDLPPRDVMWTAFAAGIVESGVLEENENFSGHDAWPSIATSLSVQGTPAPYWFIVRKTNDLGQLKAMLGKAVQHGNSLFKQRLESALRGIDAIQRNEKLLAGDSLVEQSSASRRSASIALMNLGACRVRHAGRSRAFPLQLTSRLNEVMESSTGVGSLLSEVLSLLDSLADLECRRFWARILCEAAMHVDDAPAVWMVLSDKTISGAHAEARKALARLDLWHFGPPMELPSPSNASIPHG